MIAGIGRRAVAGYHASAYAESNVVIAAAGNVEHEHLVRLLRRERRGQAATGGRRCDGRS